MISHVTSSPSSAEVKQCVELYLHSKYAFMAWCSVEAQEQLHLYLTYVKWSPAFRSYNQNFVRISLGG